LHLITDFAVDEFIDELPRKQNAEPAGAHTLRVTDLDVAYRIVRWIGYGRVRNLVQGKTFPRVTDVACHHMTGTYIRNLHLLMGVKTAAVLDCVRQHFTESGTNRSSFRVRQFGDLIEELEDSLRGSMVAAST